MKKFRCLGHVTIGALWALLVLILALFSGYTQGERIVLDALTYLDVPYVYGECGPDEFDCSGFVQFCCAKYDVRTPRFAADIGEIRPIQDPAHLKTGDVVCFDTVRDQDLSDHVGFWIGGNQFVHASSSAGKVVVSELEGFYLEHFTGGRRFVCPWF